jgi:hypothetical protein
MHHQGRATPAPPLWYRSSSGSGPPRPDFPPAFKDFPPEQFVFPALPRPPPPARRRTGKARVLHAPPRPRYSSPPPLVPLRLRLRPAISAPIARPAALPPPPPARRRRRTAARRRYNTKRAGGCYAGAAAVQPFGLASSALQSFRASLRGPATAQTLGLPYAPLRCK